MFIRRWALRPAIRKMKAGTAIIGAETLFMARGPEARRIRQSFFLSLLALVTVLFFGLIKDFFLAILWAVALAIAFFDLFEGIRLRSGNRSNFAAVATIALVILFVVLPLAAITASLVSQVSTFVETLDPKDINWRPYYEQLRAYLPNIEERLTAFGIDPDQIRQHLTDLGVNLGNHIANSALGISQNIASLSVQVVMMLYLLFFFLRDGRAMTRKILRCIPIGDECERHLLDRFATVARATLKGTLVVAAIQGTLGGIAFWVLGIPAALIWGVIMALLSLLPVGGSGIVWAPTAAILIIQGNYASGIALILIGTLFIGLIDNLLRPLIVGRDTKMPDYLVLMSTLGGIAWVGLSGFVVGPIIAALFVSCWQIAGRDFGGTST